MIKNISLLALLLAFPKESYSTEDFSQFAVRDAVTEFKFEDSSERDSRNLQWSKDCQVTANVECTVIKDGSPCESLRIPVDNCIPSIPITMKYEVCNREEKKWIEFSPQLTQLKSFKKTLSFDESFLPPKTCRSRSYSRVINSCDRGSIVGSFKVEGWNDEEKDGNYCFAWSFYKAKIRVPGGEPININDPTPSPTPRITVSPTRPAPETTMEIQCFFENQKNDGSFVVPCDDISFFNFNPNNLQRSIMFRYIVNNKSKEQIRVSALTVTREHGQIFSFDPFFVGPGNFGIQEEVFFVDLASLSNEYFESNSDIKATGVDSGIPVEDSAGHVFHVPDLFRAELLHPVQCTIENEDKNCQEYLSGISVGDPGCDTRVIFMFRLKNTGLVCNDISQAKSTIDGKGPFAASIFVPRNFCPGEIINIDQRHPINLCNFFGEDIEVAIALNEAPFDSWGESFVSFPEENSMTFAPTPPPGEFDFEVTRIDCQVTIDGVETSCFEYISSLKPTDNWSTYPQECIKDIKFRLTLSQTGDKCEDLVEIRTSIEGNEFQVNTSEWSAKSRKFCPGETMRIHREEYGVNVCALAGEDIAFEVSIDDKKAEAVLSIPDPNTVTFAPTPTPDLIKCDGSMRPDALYFEYTGNSCDSSLNSQGWRNERRKNRGLRRNRKGGGGKGKSPNTAPTTNKSPTEPASSPTTPSYGCDDIRANLPTFPRVTISSCDGADILRSTPVPSDGIIKLFSPIPDDITVKITDDSCDKGTIYQISTYHVSCSIPLILEEEFGALKLVGFVLNGNEIILE